MSAKIIHEETFKTETCPFIASFPSAKPPGDGADCGASAPHLLPRGLPSSTRVTQGDGCMAGTYTGVRADFHRLRGASTTTRLAIYWRRVADQDRSLATPQYYRSNRNPVGRVRDLPSDQTERKRWNDLPAPPFPDSVARHS